MATLSEVLDLARSGMAAGRDKEALSLAQLILHRCPNELGALEISGKIHLQAGDLREARGAFERLLAVDPEHVVARSAVAIIAEEEGDPEAAFELFQRAYEIDPANQEIASEISRLQGELGRNMGVDSGSSMHSAGRRYLAEKKYESAVPWLQEALRVAPNAVEVAMALGTCYWLAWRPREAEEVGREVLARHPNSVKALAILAGSVFSRGGEETQSLLAKTACLDAGNGVARSLFAEAGLVLPEGVSEPEIPDEELALVLAGEVPSGQSTETAGARTIAEPEEPVDETVGEDATAVADEPALVEPQPAEEEPEGLSAVAFAEEGSMPEPDAEEAEPASAPVEARLGEQETQPEDGASPLLRRLAAAMSAVEDADSEPMRMPERKPVLIGESEVAQFAAPTPEEVEQPGRRDTADEHLALAESYRMSGQIDLALAEYREALRLDANSAATVSEAVEAIGEAYPEKLEARWLEGDALAVDGQFRRAVESYLGVLKTNVEEPDPHS